MVVEHSYGEANRSLLQLSDRVEEPSAGSVLVKEDAPDESLAENQDTRTSPVISCKRSRTTEADDHREDISSLRCNEDIPRGKRRKSDEVNKCDSEPQQVKTCDSDSQEVKKCDSDSQEVKKCDLDLRETNAERQTNVPHIVVQGLQHRMQSVLAPENKGTVMALPSGGVQILVINAMTSTSNGIGDTMLVTKSSVDHNLLGEIENLRKNQILLKQRISRFHEVFKNKVLLKSVLQRILL